MSTVRVRFDDLGRELQVEPGCTLLEVAETANLPMEAQCGGFAMCNSCRVRVLSGALDALDPVEAPFLDRPDQRLGCQAHVVGDVVLMLDPG